MQTPLPEGERLAPKSLFGASGSRLAVFALLFLGLSVAVPLWIQREFNQGARLDFDARLMAWPTLAAALGLLTVYFVSDGLRLHFSLRALGFTVPRRKLVQLVFINILVSNVTPMATGGGVAQIWYLKRYGVPVGAAAAATTLRTLLAMAVIFLATPVLALALPFFERDDLIGKSAAVLGIGAVAYLGFFALLIGKRRWVARATLFLLGLLQASGVVSRERAGRWKFRLAREALRFSGGLRAGFYGRRSDLAWSALFTALFLLALFSFPSLLFWALDIPADYFTTVGLLVVATFAMYFAPTPGGAGFAEGAFGLFFATLAPAGQLALIIVAWRFLTIYLGMIAGLVVTARELSRKEKDRG